MLFLAVLLFIVSLICLPLSLIIPQLFGKITNGSRLRGGQIFGGSLLFLFVVIGMSLPKDKDLQIQNIEGDKKNINDQSTNEMPKQNVNAPTMALITPTFTPTSTLTPTITPTGLPTPKKLLLQPTDTPIPTVFVPPTSSPQIGGFTCNCAKTCSQMSSCAEAQYQLNSCGCGARDSDNDGIACDSDCQ